MGIYVSEKSNFKLDSIEEIDLNVAKYTPLKGSSWVPTPEVLARKKAIINVKNSDKKCFLWAILAALFPADKHTERVSKYKEHEDEIKVTGVVLGVYFLAHFMGQKVPSFIPHYLFVLLSCFVSLTFLYI